jgi:hypothetical protein
MIEFRHFSKDDAKEQVILMDLGGWIALALKTGTFFHFVDSLMAIFNYNLIRFMAIFDHDG